MLRLLGADLSKYGIVSQAFERIIKYSGQLTVFLFCLDVNKFAKKLEAENAAAASKEEEAADGEDVTVDEAMSVVEDDAVTVE